MRRRFHGLLPLGSALLCLTIPAAAAEEGNVFTNIFKYGGTTVPPSQPKELEAAYCPTIDVPEGGAALQVAGGRMGDAASIRTQITLGRLARECTRLQDGSITVKVGIEGRVLLGPGGRPGKFDVPFTVAIRQNEKTVVSRTRRVSATVPAGEAQGFFSVVEDGLIVPPAMTRDYEISVSLGGSGAPKPARKRKAPAAATAGEDAGAGAAQ
ncbi:MULTISPECIES: hypothetical protein [Methylobacterium]|uniref:Uncharacterized protein n=3 Tax=Pseudomonadota TaxID=1224 RepID=A0ABQ4T252_9HYPH|nr:MULTISPECIES: hypothetical protein [Methylobacterium]PIU05655.1 MAG: hypothetical protein COT56_13815 [Methylobacterium sp. CG09_land_8_20_14_0_10_71_15]PIU12489.1 MAG: hypothetical protein COT28_14835 [Methylobacterium sp. CG08_land_8_20_14_0_20_71_15]GBU19785.1 hypothetical protein AwMethylo_40000 [Methylobacterium sp.]GJE08818.1 hypothetical protein AOPFMNJM_4164 [Methylobacterium jeotgali]